MLTFPIAHFGQGSVTVSQTDYDYNESNLTTYSFSQSIGPAKSGRFVVVGVFGFQKTSVSSISSVTIGGIAAVELASVRSADNLSAFGFYGGWIPTGTTAVVDIIFSGAMHRCSIVTWTLQNLRSNTPIASDSSNVQTLTPSTTVAAHAGGAVLSICGVEGWGDAAFVWNELNEDIDSSVDPAFIYSSFSAAHIAGEDVVSGDQTVSVVQSKSSVRQVLLTISMR